MTDWKPVVWIRAKAWLRQLTPHLFAMSVLPNERLTSVLASESLLASQDAWMCVIPGLGLVYSVWLPL